MVGSLYGVNGILLFNNINAFFYFFRFLDDSLDNYVMVLIVVLTPLFILFFRLLNNFGAKHHGM
jgi:hypothetical protein